MLGQTSILQIQIMQLVLRSSSNTTSIFQYFAFKSQPGILRPPPRQFHLLRRDDLQARQALPGTLGGHDPVAQRFLEQPQRPRHLEHQLPPPPCDLLMFGDASGEPHIHYGQILLLLLESFSQFSTFALCCAVHATCSLVSALILSWAPCWLFARTKRS